MIISTSLQIHSAHQIHVVGSRSKQKFSFQYTSRSNSFPKRIEISRISGWFRVFTSRPLTRFVGDVCVTCTRCVWESISRLLQCGMVMRLSSKKCHQYEDLHQPVPAHWNESSDFQILLKSEFQILLEDSFERRRRLWSWSWSSFESK